MSFGVSTPTRTSTPQKMSMARMMAKSLMSFLTWVKAKGHVALSQGSTKQGAELLRQASSQLWGRTGWSWTSSDTWSRCRCQRTGWRTWGRCLGQTRRPSPPARLCTSGTPSWWGTTTWRSLAAEATERLIITSRFKSFAHIKSETSFGKLRFFTAKAGRVSYYPSLVWAHIYRSKRKIKGSNSQKKKDETSDGGQLQGTKTF